MSDRGLLLGQALQRPNESLHLGASRTNGDGATVPSDERIVGGEPGHAENHVVALKRGGGERGGVGDRISLGGGEGACGDNLSLSVDEGSIGELDGAFGGREREIAAASEGGVDEVS